MEGLKKYYLWYKDTGEWWGGLKIPCSKNHKDIIPHDAHFVVANQDFKFGWGLFELFKKGVNVKNCIVCKYMSWDLSDQRRCNLYKKFNLPKYPDTKSAMDCKYFRIVIDANELGIPYDDDFKYEVVVRNREY